ncbi:MAG: rhomboid family intramembrane serine protease [Candidatus Binatus sp.]|uniref:rhomboid family intramembrane serine protease n=1 Tax=Candidatus Binatus sp. TaxID=2811406 RepID=UPI00272659B5|nr:rhomboid family intramembrane serine protease [Candidatus Binatus sp.]MDO8434299.1 rhomboid family intramembrane serine protease [Candidatus Binatus sp.]
MIPLRDNAAPRRFTPVNVTLIVVNLAIFLYEVSLGPRAIAFVSKFAMIPADVAAALSMHPAAIANSMSPRTAYDSIAPLATIVTAMFLHGSIWHVLGNCLYLFIFGAAVESRMHSTRYLLFYLACGISAALATVWIAPASDVPMLGASGAIAGVLGSYFILYPRGRILTVLPLIVTSYVIEIPAVIYLLFWFGVQLYSGLAEGAQAALVGGVAWWAHVGGFLFGMAIAPMLAERPSTPRRRARR